VVVTTQDILVVCQDYLQRHIFVDTIRVNPRDIEFFLMVERASYPLHLTLAADYEVPVQEIHFAEEHRCSDYL